MQKYQDSDPIKIRTFRETDLKGITNIYNQYIADGSSTLDGHFYSLEDMKSIVDKFEQRETILVALKVDRLIGWGSIKRYSTRLGYRVCCETSIYMTPLETGKGYGRILEEQLLKTVRNFGYHHIVAKILACNQKSIQFHQNFGFEMVGIQKEIGFSQGKWQDVVIMQLIFSDIPPYNP
ncbi:MAG: N-acetyltransferase family protein [Crocosphaera sp.]